MRKLLIAVVILALIGVVALFVVGPSRFSFLTGGGGQSTRVHVLAKAPWDPYGYALREGPRTRSYNLPVVVTVEANANPNVRILVDLQNRANYYFVELTAAHTRIGKVESALEADLGIQGQAGLALPTNKVVVKRRYEVIEVVLNDVVVARAEDESFHGGSIGAGVLANSAGIKVATAQPCDPVYFADDFMKGVAEGEGWRTVTGSWQLATLRNPSLSSNAFYYVGSAPGGKPAAAAVRGDWFWDNYRFRVAAASFGTADIGLYVYYRDPDNYYLFRWNAEQQGDGSKPRKQLLKRWHGEETLLAEAPGGYQPRVWYELETEVVGPRIRAFIDGHQVLAVTDASLCFGQVGLYSALPSPAEAQFDDVLVQSVRSFDERFTEVAAGRWRPLGGTWDQGEEGGSPACRVVADAPAKAVAGSSRWRDYAVTTRIRLPQEIVPATEAGVVSHYLDETNYAVFAWQPAAGAARLEAFVEGRKVAEEHAIVHKAPGGSKHELGVEWKGAVATATLDGQAVASAWVPGLPRGAVGLHAAEAQRLAFDGVRVRFPLPPEPVLTTHEIFSRELTMELWAGAANDWESADETLNGVATQLFWHRADFPGDATIEIEVKGDAATAAAAPGGPRACRLVLSAESHKSALTGYGLLLEWPNAAKGKDAYQATLTRAGAAVAERSLPLDGPVRRVRFERQGNYVIASVNDEPILAAKDPHPLPGCRAAFATANLPVPRQDVAVFSDNVKVYTFSRASSDWRPAAGTWEISSRWECDPRWSFFSGVPEGRTLAAIWNKHALEGDVTVEFAVGPKMETARGGTNYQYTRDFNVTICADGKDLTSGYSFLFGGWDNTITAITRGTKIVAKSDSVIPRASGIHRRWFYIKVEKLGSTLNFYVDGVRVLTYADPQPLPGNRMALWTWGNGIMVSRVRISTSGFRGTEAPGTPSGQCKSIYNP